MRIHIVASALLPAVAIKFMSRVIGTPIFLCSWKPFTDSPELHNYRWYCNAQKEIIDDHAAQYKCNRSHGEDVADLGSFTPLTDLLRFSELAAAFCARRQCADLTALAKSQLVPRIDVMAEATSTRCAKGSTGLFVWGTTDLTITRSHAT